MLQTSVFEICFSLFQIKHHFSLLKIYVPTTDEFFWCIVIELSLSNCLLNSRLLFWCTYLGSLLWILLVQLSRILLGKSNTGGNSYIGMLWMLQLKFFAFQDPFMLICEKVHVVFVLVFCKMNWNSAQMAVYYQLLLLKVQHFFYFEDHNCRSSPW